VVLDIRLGAWDGQWVGTVPKVELRLARLVALPRTAPGVTILEWRVVAVGARP
jgi:hypothetical protein